MIRAILFMTIAIAVFMSGAATAGTALTYQGRLLDAGAPGS